MKIFLSRKEEEPSFRYLAIPVFLCGALIQAEYSTCTVPRSTLENGVFRFNEKCLKFRTISLKPGFRMSQVERELEEYDKEQSWHLVYQVP